jgi:uncharacterized protein YcfL
MKIWKLPLVLFAVFCVGCQTTPPPASPVATANPQVVIDPRLESSVRSGEVNTSYVGAATLVAEVALQFSGRQARQIEYRFEWFNADGRSLPSPTSRYLTAFLQASTPHVLRGVAPSADAVDFRLHIRPLAN